MIITRTPLRVSFFGGGTDIPDYYNKAGYGCVLSTAIDKSIYISVNQKFDGRIHLKYMSTELVDTTKEITHPAVKEVLERVGVLNGIEITSTADVPAQGTGLGSSSSFLVGLLNAVYNYIGIKPSPEKLAQEACDIEIRALKQPVGKQDQYISAYGGFKFIKFYSSGKVDVENVIIKKETMLELQKKLLFFYSGMTRRSGDILSEQRKKLTDNLDGLSELRSLAEKMRNELERDKLDLFGECLAKSWEIKKSLALQITNQDIDSYYNTALKAGAQGGKLLGAGGGGFLMFYCDEDKQNAVRHALGNLREFPVKFFNSGSRVVFRSSI